MRITTSDNYFDDRCDLYDCERRYCRKHRVLWRDCDTVKTGWEGDREVGMHEIYELGDCPECERESRSKRMDRDAAEWEAELKRRS